MRKSNIVLIGFMGTGKTSVGKQLASLLGMEFVDTDMEIERITGLKISEIFRRYGEQRFREEERAVVKRVAALQNAVVATGGGVVLNPENIRDLRKSGVVVLLQARPEVIARRVQTGKDRPLLADQERLLERIESLLQERAPYYQDCDFKVDTSDLQVHEVVDKIIEKLRELGWQKSLE
ncbi:MAG: shikimate kinase [Thermacetogeniaceae bacterium]